MMLRIILFFLHSPLWINCQSTKFINQDYYFIGLDEKHKMVQRADSLFDYNCYPSWHQCAEQPSEKYKIDTICSFANTKFVVLENVDALDYSTKELRPNRFKVYVYKNVSDTTLLWLNYTGTITREELNNLQFDIEQMEKKFFITYFSQKYLKRLELFQTVDTKREINKILRKFNKRWKLVDKLYFQNKENYLHYGVPAEILNLVCIQIGFNPNGVSETINEFKR